jgi:hypothetical protein
MTKTYQQFIFESYAFNPATGKLRLNYSLDDAIHFTETYTFDFVAAFANYDVAVLDRALQMLFFVAGVSYYKTYLPPEITVNAGQIDTATSNFLRKTYQRGLGEFFYVNNLDPLTSIKFPINAPVLTPLTHTGNGMLIAVGGGKDSLVSIETLRKQHADAATWSVNHRPQLEPLVQRIGLPHYWVEREWDQQLLHLNEHGALNGHVPISAIFAAVGTVVAILSGRKDVVLSNEQSANEPTLHYKGVAINHQYSKSQEFERDYQQYLAATFGSSLRYYSLLRSLGELRIAELFAKEAFDKYHDVFSSCNRAFVHGSTQLSWCGKCSKCAFVFLALTPFIDRRKLEALWDGKNLLLDPSLRPAYRQLLGIEGDKPLDCVGEVQESRAAMQLAFALYPELRQEYVFTLPDDYDFRAIKSSELPENIASSVAFS